MSEKCTTLHQPPSQGGGTGAIQQPIIRVIGEDTDSPPANQHPPFKQPVSTIFGEGNTYGSPDNKPSHVILGPDGLPKGLRLQHQQHGYTEAPDLNVIRQPISTRFGDPINKPRLPDPPATYLKSSPGSPSLPKGKKGGKEFQNI